MEDPTERKVQLLMRMANSFPNLRSTGCSAAADEAQEEEEERSTAAGADAAAAGFLLFEYSLSVAKTLAAVEHAAHRRTRDPESCIQQR